MGESLWSFLFCLLEREPPPTSKQCLLTHQHVIASVWPHLSFFRPVLFFNIILFRFLILFLSSVVISNSFCRFSNVSSFFFRGFFIDSTAASLSMSFIALNFISHGKPSHIFSSFFRVVWWKKNEKTEKLPRRKF